MAMRQGLASILFFVSTAMLPDSAMACSCARNPTADGILKGAATVFTGVAQRSAQVASARSVTTFTVIESFKGVAVGATVRVLHSSGSSASCGVKFSSGESYTLATHRIDSDPGLTTSLCSTWMFLPQVWMFLPQVRISAELIQRMRALVREK